MSTPVAGAAPAGGPGTAGSGPGRAAVPAPPPSRLRAVLTDPWRALLVTMALLAFVACLDVLGDPDVWWHLRAGRWVLDHLAIPRGELFTYTAPGAPWTAHEWLSEVLFALLRSAGSLLAVALVMAAVAWSGLVASGLRAARRGAAVPAIGLALVLGAKAAQPVLGSRPQVFTFALTCWTLFVAEQHLARGGRWRWLLPPMLAVWANLHAGFATGLGILAVVVAVEVARGWLHLPGAVAPARVRELGVATGVAAVAACLNPAGPRIYPYIIEVSRSAGSKPIVEWMTPNFHDTGLLAVVVLVATFIALPALGGRLDLRDGVLVAIGVAASLFAVRNISLLVAVALPAWAGMLTSAWEAARARRASPPRRPLRTSAGFGLFLVGVGAVVVGVSVAGAAREASASGVAAHEPVCAAAALDRAPQEVDLFAPYATSGYLIDRLWPHVRVFDYGELVAAGDRVFDDYLRISAGVQDAPSALTLLDRYRTDAVLTPKGPLSGALDASGGWRRVLDDRGLLLYVRGDAPWARTVPGCGAVAG